MVRSYPSRLRYKLGTLASRGIVPLLDTDHRTHQYLPACISSLAPYRIALMVLFFLLVAMAAGVCTIACAATAISLRLRLKPAGAATIGTLALPGLIMASLILWAMIMEVDDAPPGMVLLGNLVFLTVSTPLSFVVSLQTLRWHARRKLRHNGSSQE